MHLYSFYGNIQYFTKSMSTYGITSCWSNLMHSDRYFGCRVLKLVIQ